MNDLLQKVSRIDTHQTLILEQTTKTNGRLTAIEKWINKAQGAGIIVALIFGSGLAVYVIDALRHR